jgi:dihydroorotate dehydrogenase
MEDRQAECKGRRMPDWTYQNLFRPLLFRLPAIRARDVTLRVTAALAAISGPAKTIECFGDMRPPAATHLSAFGHDLSSPVGLGAGFDVHAVALPALAQCGFGFVEAGPVTRAPILEGRIERRERDEAIWYETPLANDGVDALVARLARGMPRAVPLGIRLAHQPGADPQAAARECGVLAERLARFAAFFTLDTRAGLTSGWNADAWEAFVAQASRAIEQAAPGIPLLLCLPPDCDPAFADRLCVAGTAAGVDGVTIAGGIAQDGGRLLGPPAFLPCLLLVRAIRERWDDCFTIVASGGIREPADALTLLDAGATCVQLHSGLVYAGPGLAKRINEAIAATGDRSDRHASLPFSSPERQDEKPATTDAQLPLPSGRFLFGWPWIALMGLGILLAGILAWFVAATRVILPYDESFLGLTYDQLAATNNRLLDFMTHDRITFAGAMIALGIVYVQYATLAMRRGAAWAWRAVVASASLGFLGFFLFIGFRYLDPLHAASTALLFVFFLLGIVKRPSATAPPTTVPDLRNDRRWRLGLWGQLLFVAIGFGFFVGGVTIALVGVTFLFVSSDLTFMHTTRDTLAGVNPRLIPLLAHDRASFGGTLVAVGITWMLGGMWGFRRGARWLWWTFLASGTPGFLTAIGIHLVVGYMDFAHLAPVYLAMALFALALALSYPYLCDTTPATVPAHITHASAIPALEPATTTANDLHP